MVPTRTLAALGRIFRRHPPPSIEELSRYAAEVVPGLERAEHLYHDWFEQVSLFVDNEKLANAAAIHRWEAATMSQALARVSPPAILAQPHAEVVASLAQASRAAQLLSNGSRFHSANAVCDGQTLLEESRERRLAAARQIHRVLERYMSDRQPAMGDQPTAEVRPAHP